MIPLNLTSTVGESSILHVRLTQEKKFEEISRYNFQNDEYIGPVNDLLCFTLSTLTNLLMYND
jgi:hypothetical protein